MSRKTYTGVSAVTGGCYDCGAAWEARNTMGVAARHHDATGHTTWVDQVVSVTYGDGDHRDAATSQPSGAPA